MLLINSFKIHIKYSMVVRCFNILKCDYSQNVIQSCDCMNKFISKAKTFITIKLNIFKYFQFII